MCLFHLLYIYTFEFYSEHIPYFAFFAVTTITATAATTGVDGRSGTRPSTTASIPAAET